MPAGVQIHPGGCPPGPPWALAASNEFVSEKMIEARLQSDRLPPLIPLTMKKIPHHRTGRGLAVCFPSQPGSTIEISRLFPDLIIR